MEFPDLGKHCSQSSCRQIDFLPVKCDACQNIFCKDHFTYAQHQCPSAYKKNVQVPVCPLCSAPVPIARGALPDAAVSLHIDNDCASDPAVKKRKIYTNRCSKKGCKVKELVKVTCDSCMLNFCLSHRHAQDHDCKGAGGRPTVSRSGLAAMQRLQGAKPSGSNAASRPVHQWSQNAGRPPVHTAAALQGNVSEDEALARTLQASLSQSNVMSQEDIDRQIAEALAASDDAQHHTPRNQRTAGSCSLS
ncbi:AN1-type zinc finger protein 2A-like [Pollicipes pollicipes]|uniref:AN1-type zinc finger protein 2A-like n=1 Tax=Pollicipes pollicipes TaxID=41117 RepID=UPI0018851A60|nr:AN1-type zinc finger protein 2A-like [Pollicipes pollicipes]